MRGVRLEGERGGGGERGKERKIRLPTVIIHLGNSVRRRTEFLIGAVGCISIDTTTIMSVFLGSIGVFLRLPPSQLPALFDTCVTSDVSSSVYSAAGLVY